MVTGLHARVGELLKAQQVLIAAIRNAK